jgi:hypothetical protein
LQACKPSIIGYHETTLLICGATLGSDTRWPTQVPATKSSESAVSREALWKTVRASVSYSWLVVLGWLPCCGRVELHRNPVSRFVDLLALMPLRILKNHRSAQTRRLVPTISTCDVLAQKCIRRDRKSVSTRGVYAILMFSDSTPACIGASAHLVRG